MYRENTLACLQVLPCDKAQVTKVTDDDKCHGNTVVMHRARVDEFRKASETQYSVNYRNIDTPFPKYVAINRSKVKIGWNSGLT